MLHGRSKIELENVNTGKKEVYINKNIVTNFFSDILNLKFRNFDFYGTLFPLYKKGLGGVLLFGDNIPEDPNIYVAPSDATIIGHAGSNAYSGTDTMRGSFNEVESAKLENGYRFVWDFNTSQANGEIKCLSLTSERGGSYGLGSRLGEEKYYFDQFSYYLSNSTSLLPSQYLDMDYSYAYKTTGSSITITKDDANIKNIYLTSGDMKHIFLSKTYDSGLTDIRYTYYYKTKDKVYILICEESKNAVMMMIDKKTLELDKMIDMASIFSYVRSDFGFVIIKNFMYTIKLEYKSSLSGYIPYVYKINLDNITDIKILGGRDYFIKESNSFDLIGDWGGRLLTSLMIIDENDVVSTVSHLGYNVDGKLNNIYKDVCFFNKQRIGSSTYNRLFLYSQYLATINNLQTPVVKTADKTMKITYVVTES